MLKKIIISLLFVLGLAIAFVCGQLSVVHNQQLGVSPDGGRFETTVNAGGQWHRWSYTDHVEQEY